MSYQRCSSSLERGLSVLELFEEVSDVVYGAADVAAILGYPRTTAYRYVATLADRGYLEQVEDRKYKLAY